MVFCIREMINQPPNSPAGCRTARPLLKHGLSPRGTLTIQTRRAPWRPELTQMIAGIEWGYRCLASFGHRSCEIRRSDTFAGAVGIRRRGHAISKRVN